MSVVLHTSSCTILSKAARQSLSLRGERCPRGESCLGGLVKHHLLVDLLDDFEAVDVVCSSASTTSTSSFLLLTVLLLCQLCDVLEASNVHGGLCVTTLVYQGIVAGFV